MGNGGVQQYFGFVAASYRWLAVLVCVVMLGVAGGGFAQTTNDKDDRNALNSGDAAADGSKLSCTIDSLYGGAVSLNGDKFVGTPAQLGHCIAEGNCNSDGTLRGTIRGHGDPGNAARNTGYCSRQGGPSDIVGANASCDEYLRESFRMYEADFTAAGITDTFVIANALDLSLQGRGFIPQYIEQHKRLRDDVGLTGAELLLETRVAAGYKPGAPTGAGSCTDSRVKIANSLYCGGGMKGCTPGKGCWTADQERRINAMAGPLNASGCTEITGSLGGSGANSSAPKPFDIAEIPFLSCWSCELIQAVTRVATGLGQRVFAALNEGLKGVIGAFLGLLHHLARHQNDFALWPVGKWSPVN